MTTTRRLPATLATLLAATLIVSGCNSTDSTPAPRSRTATATRTGRSGPATANNRQATILPARVSSTQLPGQGSDTRSIAEKVGYIQSLPYHDRNTAAQALGLSEAHLLAADVGKNVIRLKDGPDTANSILLRLHELGQIRASARNADIILNVTGTTPPGRLINVGEGREPRTFPGYFGPPIDLRPNLSKWQFTFAQITFTREGQARRSLNFFDAQGRAIQRLTLDNPEGIAAFEKILKDYRADAQTSDLALAPEDPDERPPARPDAQVDVAGLHAAWDAMTDVHQYATILAKYDVTRTQALRLAGPSRAQPLAAPTAVAALLRAAAAADIEIMAFVSNSANTQIFTGKINAPTTAHGGWLQVTDAQGLSLLIREAGLGQIWHVKKPVNVGYLSTVEVYNAQGEIILQFYSRREPGKPESDTWRDILASLPKA